jgi:hypothetical protein
MLGRTLGSSGRQPFEALQQPHAGAIFSGPDARGLHVAWRCGRAGHSLARFVARDANPSASLGARVGFGGRPK